MNYNESWFTIRRDFEMWRVLPITPPNTAFYIVDTYSFDA